MTIDSPRYEDVSDMLRKWEQAAHCARLRRWLRASIILNLILMAAVAGIVAGYSSSDGAAASATAPIFRGSIR